MSVSRRLLCLVAVLAGHPAQAEDLPAAARRAADALATALAGSADAGNVKVVAILPLTESGVAAGQGRTAADLVGTRFAQAAMVKVLDEAALRAALGEQRLQAMLGSGRVEDPDLSTRAGAKAVISGQISSEGERWRLQIRLTALPGGKLIGTAQAFADVPSRGSARPAGAESASIEVAMRRLSDGLAAGFAKLPGNTRYRRLAVLTFAEVGAEVQKKKLGLIVTAEVATNLKRDHGLFLVERAKLGEVMGELKLQEMASPDAAQASRIGQLADAQALVLGSVAEAGDRYLVTARIVATQTGETLAAESVSVADASMAAIASGAVVLRSRGDAAFRSLLVPGLGQFYNRQPAKGWVFLGTEVALIGGAVAAQVLGTQAYDDYLAYGGGGSSPTSEAQAKYDKAASLYRTRNWLIGGAAVVWVINVVDAYASGVDGEALLGGGAVTALPVPMEGGAGLVLAGRF